MAQFQHDDYLALPFETLRFSVNVSKKLKPYGHIPEIYETIITIGVRFIFYSMWITSFARISFFVCVGNDLYYSRSQATIRHKVRQCHPDPNQAKRVYAH